MQQSGIVSTLGGFLQDVSNAAVPIVGKIYESKTTQTQLKLQELKTQEALAKKEAAQKAAANTSNFFSNKTIETVVVWTLTTIAGGVLVAVVMKAAGFRS